MDKNEEIAKIFYEERTKKYYKTLKAAKSATRWPSVYRVWLDSAGKEMARVPIYVTGESCGPIVLIDRAIEFQLAQQRKEARSES